MGRYMRQLLEPWEQLTVTCVDLAEAGDSVFAEVEQAGAGELSGAMTSFTYFQVWTFRGGTLMRLENFISREQAQEALGTDFDQISSQA
jgi:ketosteroid isomerase-like protein